MARRRKPQRASSKTSMSKDSNTSKSNNVNEVQEKSTSTKDEVKRDEATPDSKNDPEWYMQDAPAIEAAANVPFSHPFGAVIDLVENRERFGSDVASETVANSFTSDASSKSRAVAGVCTVKVVPSFGDNTDQNDPLNVCANALYSKVRIKNNGRKNYDPADLLMYALTFGDIYAFIIWANRLYNYAFMYSQRNYYIGRDLINGNGVNHNDLIANLANFRYWLNTFINKVSSFAVPADIYYFRRRVFMFGNFYIENPYGNVKDQLYQFAPRGFYTFALDSTGKGGLVLKPWEFSLSGTLATVNDIISYGNSLLSGISGDEDFGLMSGDILRAYEGNIIGLPSVGEEGGILPVYDPVVLSQFKNCHLIHVDFNSTFKFAPDAKESFRSAAVMQDAKGNIITRYFIEDNDYQSQLIAGTLKVISVENPTPGVGDVVEATRLMVAAKGFATLDGDPSVGERKMYVVGGTDLAISVEFLVYTPQGLRTVSFNHSTHVDFYDGNGEQVMDALLPMQFKYAPIMYEVTTQQIDNVKKVARFNLLSNIDNYACIGNDQLVRIHDAANLSLFYVPGVAKMVSTLQ